MQVKAAGVLPSNKMALAAANVELAAAQALVKQLESVACGLRDKLRLLPQD